MIQDATTGEQVDDLCSSVHPPETDLQYTARRAGGHLDASASLAETFRHSGWSTQRRRVLESMIRTDQSAGRRSEFSHCGSHAYVLRCIEDPTVYRIAGSACHDRFCLPCANERSNAIKLNVLEALEGKQVRFLTLTVKSTHESLRELLDHIYESFQKLRRRGFWKKRVTGGVAFLEVKWYHTRNRWHPHFHILIQGRYMPQQHLKKLWHEITGDSSIVDIRAVPDTGRVAGYVTKYACKPLDRSFALDEDRLDEAMIALKGRKLAITFGNWRGIILARTIVEGAWDNVGELQTILERAAHGDLDSREIIASITDADLSELYARAPPATPQRPPVAIADEQLTWLGAWRSNGTYRVMEN